MEDEITVDPRYATSSAVASPPVPQPMPMLPLLSSAASAAVAAVDCGTAGTWDGGFTAGALLPPLWPGPRQGCYPASDPPAPASQAPRGMVGPGAGGAVQTAEPSFILRRGENNLPSTPRMPGARLPDEVGLGLDSASPVVSGRSMAFPAGPAPPPAQACVPSQPLSAEAVRRPDAVGAGACSAPAARLSVARVSAGDDGVGAAGRDSAMPSVLSSLGVDNLTVDFLRSVQSAARMLLSNPGTHPAWRSVTLVLTKNSGTYPTDLLLVDCAGPSRTPAQRVELSKQVARKWRSGTAGGAVKRRPARADMPDTVGVDPARYGDGAGASGGDTGGGDVSRGLDGAGSSLSAGEDAPDVSGHASADASASESDGADDDGSGADAADMWRLSRTTSRPS